MNQRNGTPPNIMYFIGISAITFLLPVIGSFAEVLIHRPEIFSLALFGKWFIFSAVGVRLFIAGIKQTINPEFTAKEIFQLSGAESFPIIRELGFSNLCFGLLGIISLLQPEWRIASAFASGLYYGLAGIQHLLKKPTGSNEIFALVTDFLIFIFLAIYFIKMI